LYEVFSPPIRDANIINGLNQLLMRIEDLCGLSRGTMADANVSEARTATEMRILKQRSYTTISDNQKALEICFRDVIRSMDKFATIYNLAPEGDYDVSFDWDDSILVDKSQEMNEDLALVSSGLMSKIEFRQRHFGETKAQAKSALAEIQNEQMESMQSLIPQLDINTDDNDIKGVSPGNGTQPTPPTTPTS
jgi:A118 family predicted phage portal protein